MRVIPIARCFLLLGSISMFGSPFVVAVESDVMITEINYNVAPENTGGEFIEITNSGSADVDIGNWVVDQAVSFVIPSATILGPSDQLILANNAQTAAAFYGVPIFGEYTRRLSNGGDTIVLKNASLVVIDVVTYDDDFPWPTEADGGGPSLELIDLELDNNNVSNWGIGQPHSPGKTNTPLPGGAVGSVAISEIMYKPRRSEEREKFDRVNKGRYFEEGDDEFGEYVEVVNVTTRTIDLTGWALTDGIDYLFDNVSIAPGETILIAADPDAVKDRTGQTALGPFNGSLDNGGERLTLRDESDTLVDTVRYNDKPPWPVSPDQFGTSLEVIDPRGDNSTAANWRTTTASFLDGSGLQEAQVFVEDGDVWRYFKGTSEFPPGWTSVEFSDAGWHSGQTGIGYGDDDDRTVLADMEDNYISFAARKTFHVSQSRRDAIGQLILWVDYDDAFVAYLNGVEVARDTRLGAPGTAVPYDKPAEETGHEAGTFERHTINASRLNAGPGAAGDNVLAIQLHNRSIGSSDASMTTRLASYHRSWQNPTKGQTGGGTPGFTNSVNAVGLPPFVSRLEHDPAQPTSSQTAQITAFIQSDLPLTSVQAIYSTNTATSTNTVTMFDDGAHGDGAADDGFWSGEIPAHASPTFVNYRIRATDSLERTTVYPYDGEPSETQAYLSFDNDISTTLPIYHLYITGAAESVLVASPYEDRYVNAHLAIDGAAYPNIDVRLRGRQSRKNPKRQWKFRFNRHQLHEGNRTLDTMLNMPFIQWFTFELFDRVEIKNLAHDLIRVYKNGSFFGVYIMFESPNSSWVRKEGLPPTTEIYKARTLETPNESKNSDLYTNQIHTDWDFWGVWNKKLRSLQRPTHIQELTFNLNNMNDSELLPWLDQNVNLDEWFKRWITHLLMGARDFNGHNYYAIRPGEGGKWTMVSYDYDHFAWGQLPPFYGDGTNGDPNQRNKLYQRVSRNRTLRRIWTLKLREVLDDYWDLGEIFEFLDNNFTRIRPDRSLDLGRWGQLWSNGTRGAKSFLSGQRSLLDAWMKRQSLPAAAEIPTVNPTGDDLTRPGNVSISVTPGRAAYYTVDGSDPRLSTTRQLYTAPFSVAESTTVRAAAISGSLGHGDWTDLAETTFDIPTNASPLVEDQEFATDEAIAIRLSVDDPDGPGPYRYEINGPSGGSLSGTAPNLTYTPNPGTGFDSFTWSVNDGLFDSEIATVKIDIISVNAIPVGTNQNVSTSVGMSVDVALSFVDPDGPGPFTYSVKQPASGTLVGTPPLLTYTPQPGFFGDVAFSWTVEDGIDSSQPATVAISISDNQPPTVQEQNVTTRESTATAITLSFVDSDGPGPYVYTIDQPQSGTLSGDAPNLVYTPFAGFTGQDSFTYSVNDGLTESLAATVTVTVMGEGSNHPPTPVSLTVTTRQGEPVSIALTFVDPDGPGPYTYRRTSPSHGTVTGTAPDLTYRPGDGFFGQDSFTYRINDGIDLSTSSATVTINVEQPVAPSCYCDDEVGTAFSVSNVGAGAHNYSEAIGVSVFDPTCRDDDCSASGTHEIRGVPGARIEDHLYLNIISQIPSDNEQISGWAFAVKFDNNGTSSALTDVTTTNTAGCDVDDCPGVGLIDGGFDQTELISPSDNGGQEGAVSAVVMTFNPTLITLPAGQTTILDLTFEVTVPQTVTDSPAAKFSLVDGLRGSGFPVNSAATIGSSSVPYGNARTVGAKVIAIPGADGSARFIRADYNGNGFVEPLTDPVFLLRWLFLSGPAPPCIAACDFNADGKVLINDPVALLNWGFRGGPDPVEPFPNCGASDLSTDKELGCEAPPGVCR